MKRYSLLLLVILSCLPALAQGHKELTLTGFNVELNNLKVEHDPTISEVLYDQVPKSILVFDGSDFDYIVEFRFKRDGNRIKIRRASEVVLTDGTRIKGNKKKEVQFMSASAPGTFEFPVAENIVLDKEKYSTFFISYRAKIKYQ